MNMPKNTLLTLALAAAVALGFVIGKTTRSDSPQTSTDTDDHSNANHQSSAHKSTSRSTNRSTQRKQRGRNISRTMKTMISQLERSPMAQMDFDGMFQIWETMRDFSEDEILQALTSIANIKNPQTKMMLQMMIMNRWGKLNGQAAIEHALTEKNNQSKMMGVMGSFMSWTKADPEAAFTWYENNQEKLTQGGGIYSNIYEGMIYQSLAKHNLSRALDRVEKIETQSKRKQALTSIAQAVVNEPAKLKKFLQYLDTHQDANTKKEVMTSVIGTMAMQNPESAKTYISTVNDPDEKKGLTKTLIQRWAYMDPEAAISWGMEQTQNQETQKTILDDNFHTWISQDSKSASAWYDKQPAHLKSDDLISNVSMTLAAQQQYKKAFVWAARGEDAEKTTTARTQIYQKWLKTSPTDAKAWAEGEGKETMQGIDLSPTEDD